MWTNAQAHLEPADSYHSRLKETSASQTKDYIASPRGYFRKHFLGVEKKTTTAMEFGSAVHEEALLDAIERSYLVIPKEVLTKAGAKNGNAWEAYKAENAGRLLLKEGEVEAMNSMIEAVKKHPLGKALFESDFVYKELTITADAKLMVVSVNDDESEGSISEQLWPVRGRLDYVRPGRIMDLKTTGDLSPKSMRYKPYDLGWDVSGEYYRRLWQALTGELVGIDYVVVESKEPYRVEVWSPGDETLAKAGAQIDQAHQEMFANWCDFTKSPDENIWNRPGFDQINLF